MRTGACRCAAEAGGPAPARTDLDVDEAMAEDEPAIKIGGKAAYQAGGQAAVVVEEDDEEEVEDEAEEADDEESDARTAAAAGRSRADRQ